MSARKKSYITVTDQFCGAGGSSQGAKRILDKTGGQLTLALNHWKLAIETHNTNFPDTLHDCTDISACDPRIYPSTDILITSPECTTHSPAGGNNHKTLKKQMDLFNTQKIDPSTERSRATMWDVCRFSEYHSYNAIIVENVVEAKTRWVLFDEWLMCMHKLGYDHKCVYINSMHCHPTPQSRDRMYIVFWKKKNKAPRLDYTPIAYCHACEKNISAVQTWKNVSKKFGKYRQQYLYCCSTCTSVVEPYYYAAFNCIDWSDIGTRISDRSKPLSENTINRIKHGLNKYGKQPLIIRNQTPGNCKPSNMPIGAQTCINTHYLLSPFIIHASYGKEARGTDKSIFESAFTQTSIPSQALINHPFIIKQCHTQANGEYVRSLSRELQSQTTREEMSLVMPFLVQNKGMSKTRDITEPSFGQTCKPSMGLVTNDAWNSFLSYNYNGEQTSHITEATDGVNCKERISVINYQEPTIDECYYRMLKPREIKLAMAFDHDYVVLGSSKDQVKQLGNAVTPPAMEWLVQQVIESLN